MGAYDRVLGVNPNRSVGVCPVYSGGCTHDRFTQCPVLSDFGDLQLYYELQINFNPI
jgi:hypothetical protein